MQTSRDQTRKTRHIDHEQRTDLVSDLAEATETVGRYVG